MKKSKIVLALSVACMAVGVIAKDNENAAALAGFGMIVLLPISLSIRKKEKKAEYAQLPAEEKEKIDAERERAEAKRQEQEERLNELKAVREADKTIVSTAIVNTTSKGTQKASVTSSVVRASVGGLFSPGWALVGALTPKKTTVTKDMTVTFSILYASGKRGVETVKVGSKRYNELAKYIA